MKTKYLFVVPSLSKGGAERVVSLLASEISRNNDKEVIVVTHFKTSNDYIVDKKVKIICLSNLYEEDYRKKINFLYLIKLLHRLRKKILEEKPTYIIPFLWSTCIRVDIALTCSKYKSNVIQTVRNNPNIYPEKYRNYLVKKSFLTIVQNKEQKDYFPSKIEKKIKIVPNPVSNDVFEIKRDNSYNPFIIIGVGRLENQKNFKLLIDSFNIVQKDYQNIILKIYGDGSQREELQGYIQELNLSEKITLCGRKERIDEIYKDANLFILSSSYEGMPNTLIEAMGSGLICISTNCPTGPSDIIKNGENGFLIENGSKDEMVKLITYVYNHYYSLNNVSKNAKKYIEEHYSLNKIADIFMKNCEEGKNEK